MCKALCWAHKDEKDTGLAMWEKHPPANAGDSGSIPGWGRCPGGGNGNPLQCSCLRGVPWTEEPSGLQSMGLQESDTT